ncbi:hypothetical protein KY308_03155, partial [Candidatus Woesearchaeota archaeon]|nr:hypothetical protein [Candidatus Woesearchaeota archaeon]
MKKRKEEAPALESLKLDLGQKPVETVKPSPYAPPIQELPPIYEPEPFKPRYPEPTSFKDSAAAAKDRDVELLSAKMDTIKAMLESISHRLDRIEQQQ